MLTENALGLCENVYWKPRTTTQHKFVKKKYKWYAYTTFRGEKNGVIQNAQLKPGKTARVEAQKQKQNKQRTRATNRK